LILLTEDFLMTIDFKFALQAACMAVMMTGVTGIAYAADEEELESYQLSQMRSLSKGQSTTPDLDASANSDLLAETDLEELAKAAAAMEELDNVAPALSKPALPDLKPKL
jgi:hypothetical protein